MPVLGLSHDNLRGPREHIDALRDFYCEVVGLRVGPRPLPSYGHWLYAGERDVLHLSESRPGELRVQGVRNSFDHVAFRCTDFAAAERVLVERGIAYRLAVVPQTGQRQLFFTDPAGNGVELNFDPAD